MQIINNPLLNTGKSISIDKNDVGTMAGNVQDALKEINAKTNNPRNAKILKAILVHTDQLSPQMIILENSFDAIPVFSSVGTGNYLISFPTPVLEKDLLFIVTGVCSFTETTTTMLAKFDTKTQIIIYTFDGGTPASLLLDHTSILIEQHIIE